MTTVDHGFDMTSIQEQLESEDWEDSDEGDVQVRRLYLGSVFNLTPSGKYYMPFACSNLDACHTCNGTGIVLPHGLKRRTIKKHVKRHERVVRKFHRLYGSEPAVYPDSDPDTRPGMPSLGKRWRPLNKRAAFAFIDRQPKAFRLLSYTNGATCTACGGCGSREAHLDELWREAADAAFNEVGLSIEGGEGDPCDLFAVQYRYTPDDEATENDGCLDEAGTGE